MVRNSVVVTAANGEPSLNTGPGPPPVFCCSMQGVYSPNKALRAWIRLTEEPHIPLVHLAFDNELREKLTAAKIILQVIEVQNGMEIYQNKYFAQLENPDREVYWVEFTNIMEANLHAAGLVLLSGKGMEFTCANHGQGVVRYLVNVWSQDENVNFCG